MKELALEKKLYEDSSYLRHIDWLDKRVSDKKLQQIRQIQNELYMKHVFLKKYRKAKEKINEKID